MILKSSKNFEKFESFERLKEAWKAQNLTAGLDLYIYYTLNFRAKILKIYTILVKVFCNQKGIWEKGCCIQKELCTQKFYFHK